MLDGHQSYRRLLRRPLRLLRLFLLLRLLPPFLLLRFFAMTASFSCPLSRNGFVTRDS